MEPQAELLNQFSNNSEVALSEAGVLATVAREKSEIEAGIIVAKKFRRDEASAYSRLIQSCKRATFAESARYKFPRGGKDISGPSVDMAREAARCWGNTRYGLRIVGVSEGKIHIKGFAHDMENNNYVEAEDEFKNLIQRKNKKTAVTEWVEADERDLRELINRRGAILVRNCILQILPPDIIDDAEQEVIKTLRQAAAGELKTNRGEAVKKLVLAFDGIGVNTEMLTAKLGHALDLITEDELAELRAVYKSIQDGNSSRDEHFTLDGDEAKAKSIAETIREKSANRAAKKATAPTAQEVASGKAMTKLPTVNPNGEPPEPGANG